MAPSVGMATLAEVASSDEAADVAAGVKAAAEHAFHLRTGDTVMLLLTLTVVFRLIKHHWFRAVPTSIFMSIAAVASTSVLLAVTYVRPPTPGVGVSAALDGLKNFLMDFPDLLLNYMLGFLLFAAAIEVDLRALSRIRTTVFALSVFRYVLFRAGGCGCWGITLPVLWQRVSGVWAGDGGMRCAFFGVADIAGVIA